MTNPAPSPAEKAVKERATLYRHYQRAKKADLAELYADPEWGEALRKLVTTLKHFGPEHADRMLDYVTGHKLVKAPAEIRFAALQQVDHRIIRIKLRAGAVPFDDPLPGEPADLFARIRAILFPKAEVAADRKAADGFLAGAPASAPPIVQQKEAQKGTDMTDQLEVPPWRCAS